MDVDRVLFRSVLDEHLRRFDCFSVGWRRRLGIDIAVRRWIWMGERSAQVGAEPMATTR